MILYIDLPLPSSATPAVAIRGPFPTESPIQNSPFTLTGSQSSAGRFSADIGDLAAGIYRCSVTLNGTLIAIGYISATATSTSVRMVDDPNATIDYTALATAVAPAVSAVLIAALLNRFTLSGTAGTQADVPTRDITRQERLNLGHLYTANFLAYTKADMSLIINVPTAAPDCVGRLVFTAKQSPSDSDNGALIRVDSASGVQQPSGYATKGSVVAIANPTAGQPSRSARVQILAQAMQPLQAGRLYWDLRSYIAQVNPPPVGVVLSTGILDLTQPINQAVT